MQFTCWIFAAWLISLIAAGECSWGSPEDGQYHIQTDEGPERYFRFQTDNGQFRKEKRLQDGTVIGTEAWIDAAGFLRQKDYIADKQGYRILKSKTIFVGQGRPIQDAIKSTKSAPAQSGVLVDGRNGISARTNSIIHAGEAKPGGYVYSTTTPIPSTTTTIAAEPELGHADDGKLNYMSPADAAKLEISPYLGFDHYPDELPHAPHHSYGQRRPPVVHIRPHAEPIEHVHDEHSNAIGDDDDYHQQVYSTTARPATASTPAPPSLEMAPPFESNYRRVRPIAIASTTPSPITPHEATARTRADHYGFSTPAPFGAVISSTTAAASGYHYGPHAPTPPSYGDYSDVALGRSSSGAVSPLDVNNLEGGLLPPLPPTHHNYRRLRPQQAPNTVEEWDGVGTTRNGFRYFLPRQYHEEEQVDEQKRAGSFGYVDPFGIRRVVYYNASPERGFVHRNNNRYVGLGATPYDPVV